MGARVLVVEDHPTNLELMSYLLTAFGHTPILARDGEEGLAAAARERPAMILLDVQIPKLDGVEVTRRLKRDPSLREIPVVAVTALAMVGDRERLLAAGFDGYIAKPIDAETFLAQVEAFLPSGLHVAPAASSSLAADVESRAAPRARILVVDNSPVNLALVRSTLQPFGYRVTAVSSVKDGLTAARESPPDLILSDVHMPGQTGYDFFEAVKADARLKDIPFVFLSSTVSPGADEARAMAMGATRFITRPIEAEALIAEIEAVLTTRK